MGDFYECKREKIFCCTLCEKKGKFNKDENLTLDELRSEFMFHGSVKHFQEHVYPCIYILEVMMKLHLVSGIAITSISDCKNIDITVETSFEACMKMMETLSVDQSDKAQAFKGCTLPKADNSVTIPTAVYGEIKQMSLNGFGVSF